jgi:hypothetical protein
MKNSGFYQYVIYTDANDSNKIKAHNTVTGAIDSSNADAATVIQYAINNASYGGVFITKGTYALSTTVAVGNKTVLVGAGSENTNLTPSGNFDGLSLAHNATQVYISDLYLTHNQAGYSSSLIKVTDSCYDVTINNCHFFDNTTQKGYCVTVQNSAALDAFVGINEIRITNCYSYGFEAFENLVITNGGTTWATANFIQDSRVINCKIDAPLRALRTSCGANAVISRADFVACNVQTIAATIVTFDYDGGGIYLYITHVDTCAWDLHSGVNYANLGDMGAGTGGPNYCSFIGCTPVGPSLNGIGGSGSATVNIRTEWDKNYAETLKNKKIYANQNTLSGVSQDPVVKRTGRYQPASPSSICSVADIGVADGILSKHTPSGIGTASNTWDSTQGLCAVMVSGTSAGNNAGLVSPAGTVGIARRAFACRARVKQKIDATDNGRYFFGFSSATALPAAAQPLAVTDHGIIVGWNETGIGSTNWSIFHNDGSIPVIVDDITGPIAKDTNFHTIEISWTACGNITVTFDGTEQTISSDLPGKSIDLYFYDIAQVSTTTAKTLTVKGIWIESG